MFANNYISTIVENQLPEFILAEDAQKGATEPSFTKLLKKYYEYLEQSEKTVNVGKHLYDYMDVDTTRADLLKYFKTKFIPNFPEETELSKEKIIKAARDFYAKKGTPESFKFLFRILYNQDISIYFPKEDILRASDGKWKLPQALRLSIAETPRIIPGGNVNVANITANVVTANGFNIATTAITANSYIKIGNERRQVSSINGAGDYLTVSIPFANTGNTYIYNSVNLYRLIPNPYENFNFNLLERRKGVGEDSRTTCIIEKAIKTVDVNSGREIVELYVSNVTRLFNAGEYLLVDYVDANNVTQQFKSKIVSSISNLSLYRNRFGIVQAGKKYLSGDPVVIFGGLNPDSDEASKAVAFVGNVTAGGIESLSLVKDGYYFRAYQNGLIRILTSSGVGANVLIAGIWEDAGNSELFNFSTDSIAYKKDITLNIESQFGYDFDNVNANIYYTTGAGNTTSTVNLNTTNFVASTVDDYYNSSVLRIVDGTGSGGAVNTATIVDYNGTTRIATLSEPLSIAPDGTSNIALYANANTTIQRALSYDSIRLGKIRLLDLEDGGSFFEEAPTFDAISVYETDYVKDLVSVLNPSGFQIIPDGQFDDYRPEVTPYPTINIANSNTAYSTANGFYNGCRLFLDVGGTSHYRDVIDYVVDNPASPTYKTLYLDSPFETNISNTNILNYRLYMDFRLNVRNLGKLGTILVTNGGAGYSSNDQIVFDGTGYGAAATLNISGGVITGVTITNRGEGYYQSPTYRILNSSGGTSTGANAQLTILGLSDGEEITAQAEDIGKIQSFRIADRGFDYSETPTVSLKVVDVLTDNLTAQTIVVGGDTVWQGNTTNALSTFNGIIDEIYRPDSTNTVIRVFNYNGLINVSQPMYVATGAGNVTINVMNANANISFNDYGTPVDKAYPLYYGNGLAKANAEFLRGLIKYDGFYLNTDGFLSSDKKLQNKDYYHNYSYEIQSEKTLQSFKDTVKPIAHPAGMQLLARYEIKNEINDEIAVSSNIHFTNTALFTNVNTSFSSNVVYGNTSNFGTTANVGDIIVINTTSTAEYRIYSRLITFVDSANDIIWLDRPIGGLGDGRFLANSGNANVTISKNVASVSESLEVGDNVAFNIAGTVYNRYIVDIANTRIQLNAAVSNTGNSLYIKQPTYNVVGYEIISTNG